MIDNMVVRFGVGVLLFLYLQGCASIVGKTHYDIEVLTKETNVEYEIYNKKSIKIHKGMTPETVKLSASAGYFSPESYVFVFSGQDGKRKEVLPGKVDGLYFGNFFFGGILGMFFVDPTTGSMWSLDRKVGDGVPEYKPTVRHSRRR